MFLYFGLVALRIMRLGVGCFFEFGSFVGLRCFVLGVCSVLNCYILWFPVVWPGVFVA